MHIVFKYLNLVVSNSGIPPTPPSTVRHTQNTHTPLFFTLSISTGQTPTLPKAARKAPQNNVLTTTACCWERTPRWTQDPRASTSPHRDKAQEPCPQKTEYIYKMGRPRHSLLYAVAIAAGPLLVSAHDHCYFGGRNPTTNPDDSTVGFCPNEDELGFCCNAEEELDVQMRYDVSDVSGDCADLHKEVRGTGEICVCFRLGSDLIRFGSLD